MVWSTSIGDPTECFKMTRVGGEIINLSGSITVWLTSCLFCLDSAALLVLNEQQFKLFGQIQISQTGSQPHSDTSPYDERSLVGGLKSAFPKQKQWEPTHHSLYLSSE